MKSIRHTAKYLIGFIVCLLIRLVPFRPANVEPITATLMPFGKKWGWLAGGFFGAMSILLFDLIHPMPGFSRLGIWTLVTAAMYGLMGAAAGLYLKSKGNSIKHFIGFSVAATLIYDFITGQMMSSMLFKMPFMVTLVGQVPFTLWHLGGNIAFAIILSPLLYRWVIDNSALDLDRIWARIAIASKM
jgi:hypothetical protein